jgi:hypothetical protein
MQDHDQKPIQGWKAASIMLGVAAFLLLATWIMNTQDKSESVAMTNDSGQTVGRAPARATPSQ